MIIIKIGGGESINLKAIVEDLKNVNEKFLIVHGANAYRDELAKKLGIEKQIITSASGFESVFSNQETIDLMMMSYAGLKNKKIVELCQQNGINAIGLSGLDGGVIRAKRNNGIRVKENGKLKIVRDLSGKPKEINTHLLELLMENNYTPVLCVPLLDKNNVAVNSENDDIVALIKNVLNVDKVIHLIEAKGFLDDVNNPDSVINKMSAAELKNRIEKVDGRIKRKLYAINKIFANGEAKVFISDGRIENPITKALNGEGTILS